jgi:hypothetical protein
VKYQLETIPVFDAWVSDVPCPVCALMNAAEKRHIQYFLGNSVMNPENRIMTNETGFCSRHLPMMREAGEAHHLGLISHTRLQTVRNRIGKSLETMVSRPVSRSARHFAAVIRETLSGCLVCRALEIDLKRYLFTAVSLYCKEAEFRTLFASSRGPCLPHAADLADMAAVELDRKNLKDFIKGLGIHLEETSSALEDDVLQFTRKFDAQNDGMEWGGAKDAHARTVQFLSGVPVRLKD